MLQHHIPRSDPKLTEPWKSEKGIEPEPLRHSTEEAIKRNNILHFPNIVYWIKNMFICNTVKSEETPNCALKLKLLSLIGGVPPGGNTIRNLEFTIAQSMKWKLRNPTAATFANLLGSYIYCDNDGLDAAQLRYQRFGANLVNSYLDLSLSGESIFVYYLNLIFITK